LQHPSSTALSSSHQTTSALSPRLPRRTTRSRRLCRSAMSCLSNASTFQQRVRTHSHLSLALSLSFALIPPPLPVLDLLLLKSEAVALKTKATNHYFSPTSQRGEMLRLIERLCEEALSRIVNNVQADYDRDFVKRSVSDGASADLSTSADSRALALAASTIISDSGDDLADHQGQHNADSLDADENDAEEVCSVLQIYRCLYRAIHFPHNADGRRAQCSCVSLNTAARAGR